VETIGEDLRQMIRTPLSRSHVEALRAAGKVVTYPKGTIMVQQGEKANRFVYVEEGEIESSQSVHWRAPLSVDHWASSVYGGDQSVVRRYRVLGTR
jgi:hypothetical protein